MLNSRAAATPRPQTYPPLITDPAFQRREANTYLTYPEWHIVFAYDGLAQAVKTGDEYAFDYFPKHLALLEFRLRAHARRRATWRRRLGHAQHDPHDWRELHGGDVREGGLRRDDRRATAWVRGSRKTPQDAVVAAIATDYAAFLRQTPWYQYPFDRKARELWAAPVDQGSEAGRGGLASAWSSEPRPSMPRSLRMRSPPPRGTAAIRSVIAGLDAAALARMPEST